MKKPLSLEGKDFWGRRAKITFSPTTKEGWYWNTGNHIVPIDHRIAHGATGRIELRYKKAVLPIYEHIGPLRFEGIDNVEITLHSPWPPYFGGMCGYYPGFLLEGMLEATNCALPWIQPRQEYLHNSYNKLNASTEIKKSAVFSLLVYSKWPGLPEYYEEIQFSKLAPDDRWKFWNAKPQGTVFRKKVATIIGWPNMGYVSWKNEAHPKEVSYRWWCHRVQDILGCLSLAHHRALPLLRYESFCAGHNQDLIVLKNAFM